jgi:DNA-binding transcriptional LysR family regulator
MDTRLLKHFVAVYEERNITKAAKRCFISQPALSHSIHQLEEALHVTVFERGKKGVLPTQQADFLYPVATRILKELDGMSEIFHEKNPIYQLSLSLQPDIAHADVAKFLAVLKQVLMPLQLTLLDESQPADLRLTLDLLKKADELFLPLWREDYVLCLPAHHPLAKKKQITLADLDQQDFIECPPCHAHRLTIDTLADMNKAVNIVASTQSKQQVLSLILAGFGISFLPQGMAEQHGLITRPFKGPNMYRVMGVAYSATQRPSAAVQMVLDYFKARVGDRLRSLDHLLLSNQP